TEGALEWATPAGIEAAELIDGTSDEVRREIGQRCRLEPWKLVEEMVDRREAAGGGILQHPVQPAIFRLTGEQPPAHLEGRLQIERHLRQHGQAAGDVEATDHHRDTGGTQRASDVECARELVGLYTDQADQAKTVMALELRHDVLEAHPCVRFVAGSDVD